MNILVLGSGPLPTESGKMASAHGLRTQQFIDGIDARHDVSLVTLEKNVEQGIERVKTEETARHYRVASCLSKRERQISDWIEEWEIDVVVSVNTQPSAIAAKVCQQFPDLPLWSDLNGWVMAELQVQAAAQATDLYLPWGWQMEREVLTRADKISTVSNPQKYATIGELASLGRLSSDMMRHSFVSVIHNANRHFTVPPPAQPWQFRGYDFPKDAYVVLWLGGFNAWADSQTFFAACEAAIKQNPKIHIVVTGKELKGIDQEQYPWFVHQAQRSQYHQHFHLAGWVPSEQLPHLMQEVDLGVNVDVLCPETEIGARNRLNEFAKWGLPTVSTEGCEIVSLMAAAKTLAMVPSGNTSKLAETIVQLSQDKPLGRQMGKRGEALMQNEFSATMQLRELNAWLQKPKRAPDRGQVITVHKLYTFQTLWRYYQRYGFQQFWHKCLDHVSRTIGLKKR